MIIPESIRFMGCDYEIRICEEEEIPGLSGQYAQWWSLIRLAKNSEQQMAATLMHEIIEMICRNLEVGLEHDKITIIADSLFHIFRDNQLEFHKKD
jgi:hypothetical protein